MDYHKHTIYALIKIRFNQGSYFFLFVWADIQHRLIWIKAHTQHRCFYKFTVKYRHAIDRYPMINSSTPRKKPHGYCLNSYIPRDNMMIISVFCWAFYMSNNYKLWPQFAFRLIQIFYWTEVVFEYMHGIYQEGQEYARNWN